MPGVFVSHSSATRTNAKDYVDRILVDYLGVRNGGGNIFFSQEDGRIPQGSLMDARIFTAALDAEVMVIYATKEYFKSYYCTLEAGIALARNDGVYALLDPSVSMGDIPPHLSWFGWRYAHDPRITEKLRMYMDKKLHIDRTPEVQRDPDAFDKWSADIRKKIPCADENLQAFNDSYPHILDFTPYCMDIVKANSYMCRVAWELQDGSLVPIVFSPTEQTSLMNSDRFINRIKEIYGLDSIIGFWPENDKGFGVTVQTGNSGETIRNQESVLEKHNIPLPSVKSVTKF